MALNHFAAKHFGAKQFSVWSHLGEIVETVTNWITTFRRRLRR